MYSNFILINRQKLREKMLERELTRLAGDNWQVKSPGPLGQNTSINDSSDQSGNHTPATNICKPTPEWCQLAPSLEYDSLTSSSDALFLSGFIPKFKFSKPPTNNSVS